MKVGIVSYGAYIPRRRIKSEEIARVWAKEGKKISEGLGIREKTVGAADEDSATFAVEAARKAMRGSGPAVDPQKIGAVFVGSESKPYAVKPTATIVAEAVGATPVMTAADFEFACKAGTTAIQACAGMVGSGMIECGLAIGSDTAQAKPNDPLEYSAGGGAAAFIIGRNNLIAEIEDTYSYSTDTPDFWRRQHALFPRHAGRFTADPAYFKHVVEAGKGLLEKMSVEPKDFDYAVFHQPNEKFPLRAAKMIGFPEERVRQGLVAPFIGNTYSAASLIGLAAVLDSAKPGERIFLVSYGSGAGSDAFSFLVTEKIMEGGARMNPGVWEMIHGEKEYVDYALYAKHRKKLKSM